MRIRRPLARQRIRRRRFAAVLVVALTAGAWAAGFVVFVGAVSDVPGPTGTQTEAIVVLTGGSLRLEAGLSLLSSGKGAKLFVSGVHRGVDVKELLRVSRQSPRALDCCIVLGYAADNTRGNARETAAWMRREGYRSMTLVTANYHMPRSLLEFHTAMPQIVIVPHAVYPGHVKLRAWWISPGTAFLLAREYTKFMLAWVRATARAIGDAVASVAP